MLTRNAAPPAVTPTVLAALAVVYVVWGSTYYAIKVAIGSLPPLGMLGLRFLLAGALLYGVLRVRGMAGPTLRQWGRCAVIGTLLLGGGTGFVTLAERDASSSVAALMIAVSPLFAAVFATLWGEKTGRREWLGIGVGLLGIVLLNLGELRATPGAAVLLVLAPLCWTFGSQWSRHLPLPAGLMNSAAQMLTGGAVLAVLSAVTGEHWRVPTAGSVWALAYLVVIGGVLAYSAYTYLVAHARPALATSYAYVNPVVAILLGVLVGGEHVGPLGWAALGVIVAGVVLVAWPVGTPAPAGRPHSGAAD
ncbi:drug/metabolite transporter (DMT)-like permease [Deinococcus metalli]|uniref:Drug/metabolite exporter YedA n=1 Tax=Deinococcus metalli TaxID=1141878 RepID=A0A7W8KJB7_9DEIO|nr:drug/metabolite exporter YedA [Deinococcus metalli]MBB5378838.1 drug/metabolite transporter (DMT)-like permease [Deinococcus metalli]GHF62065.1 drug/metabolite exporter YedA [Deinococcus metalli]